MAALMSSSWRMDSGIEFKARAVLRGWATTRICVKCVQGSLRG
jgi:hypothetical protein